MALGHNSISALKAIEAPVTDKLGRMIENRHFFKIFQKRVLTKK
jgi:hypothetical protein